jgi:hypothetical protein
MKKITKNLTKNKIVLFLLLFLIVACSILIFFISNNIKSKQTTYKYNSSIYNELTYYGQIKDGKPNGTGFMVDNSKKIKINGTFVNGMLSDGTIYIITSNGSKTLTGNFKNFELNSGTIIIVDDKYTVKKEGTFKDDKLNGVGNISIVNNKTGNTDYVFTGKFENDKPKSE